MLPYFAQDWTKSEHFAATEQLICGAAARYAPNRERVAVLGCGAGGIAVACAGRFQVSIGIDLSISTVLLASRLQSGGRVTFFLDRAGWRPVRVAPEISAVRASFAVADVAALPFETGSWSAVITQYLLDAIPHPLGVIGEIERVLTTGGVWINFSRPLRIPGEPQEISTPDFTETADLFRAHGLRIVELHRTRTPYLRLEHLYDGGDWLDHEVFFTVAQKGRSAAAADSGRRRRIAAAEADVWHAVPQLVPGRRPQILERRTAGSSGPSRELEIYCAGMRATASEAECAFVDELVRCVDGRNTVGEIHARLAARNMPVSRADFSELLACLANQYEMLTLTGAGARVNVLGNPLYCRRADRAAARPA